MHATYLFYAETDDLDELIEAFREWAERNCDENNWYQELCAINSQGEKRKLAPPGDYRGRDILAEDLLKTTYPTKDMTPERIANALHGEGATLEDFKVLAWLIVAADVQIYLEEDDPEYEFFNEENIIKLYPNVREPFLRKLLDAIRRMYREADIDDNFLLGYRRRKLVFIFENLREAENPPFISVGTPYDYRCFNLNGYIESESEGASILAVDIHT